MKICEIVYERDINGKLFKKVKLYSGEEYTQEISINDVEKMLNELKSNKRRIISQPTISDIIYKQGRQYE